MTSEVPKLGDWVCYDNTTNKLQAHNVSHKRAKIGQSITMRSKLKRYFNSLFRKSRPHIPDGHNHNDEWTCHGRTLMRYTNTPPGNQAILTGDEGYLGGSAMTAAEKREQHYSTSPTLVADGPTEWTVHNGGEVRDSAHQRGRASYVAPTPTVPERSTLRMVTPTTMSDVQGIQDNVV